MATYTDAELEALMSDLESDFVERKESAADGRKIRRNICAFANDLPGDGRSGVVLIGVRDDGSCASLPIDDDLLTRLANVRGEGDILPLPSMTVQKRVLKDCEVAVVFVEPSADTPVRYHGRVWVRVGPSEIMHNLGLAQRFGLGVPLARQTLAANGNPAPEFRFEHTRVVATVRAAP